MNTQELATILGPPDPAWGHMGAWWIGNYATFAPRYQQAKREHQEALDILMDTVYGPLLSHARLPEDPVKLHFHPADAGLIPVGLKHSLDHPFLEPDTSTPHGREIVRVAKGLPALASPASITLKGTIDRTFTYRENHQDGVVVPAVARVHPHLHHGTPGSPVVAMLPVDPDSADRDADFHVDEDLWLRQPIEDLHAYVDARRREEVI